MRRYTDIRVGYNNSNGLGLGYIKKYIYVLLRKGFETISGFEVPKTFWGAQNSWGAQSSSLSTYAAKNTSDTYTIMLTMPI